MQAVMAMGPAMGMHPTALKTVTIVNNARNESTISSFSGCLCMFDLSKMRDDVFAKMFSCLWDVVEQYGAHLGMSQAIKKGLSGSRS